MVHYIEVNCDGRKEEWDQFVGFICKTMGDQMKELS